MLMLLLPAPHYSTKLNYEHRYSSGSKSKPEKRIYHIMGAGVYILPAAIRYPLVTSGNDR
jgi:hypothetical protein